MFLRGGRTAATAALAGLLLLLGVSGASAQQFGSNLQAAPNAGICTVPSGSFETSCTLTQSLLVAGHVAAGGVQPDEFGVITRFRVVSGPPTPGTGSVKLRLRLLDPIYGFAFTGGGPYVEMPLTPGIHEFPAQFQAIGGRTQIGLDTLVIGASEEAAAPLAHAESGVGSLHRWTPSPPEHNAPQPATDEGLELLLGLVVEPDRDYDGYGDRTQDQCPEDTKRHEDCDRKPPRTHLTYVPRQDFLRTKRVVVFMRSSETGRVIANGQIEISGGGATWGIYNAQKRVGRGDKVKLVLRVPANAREAAARSFAHGRRVLVKVGAYGVDAVGNESGATVATIRPQR